MDTTNPSRPLPWPLLTGTAFIVTLFLYFIDEGRYSLEGLLTVGNLVAMSIYFLGLLTGLFAMSALFAKRPAGAGRTALVLALGSIGGVALTIGFFFVLHGFSLPS